MTLFTFSLCEDNGAPVIFDFRDLPSDGDAFAAAGKMLDEHINCDHIEIWDDDRPVVGRHRFQPVIRPVLVRSSAEFSLPD